MSLLSCLEFDFLVNYLTIKMRFTEPKVIEVA